MANIYLRKYGVAATVNFELYELDGTDLIATAASATGDINLIRDEAAPEQLDADAFVDEGVVYSLVLSIAEMTAARITVYIVDQSSPKIWLDKVLIVETYGHASAQHPFDLGTASTAQTGDNYARLGAAGAGLTAVPYNAAWDAEIQSECADALTAYDPPTKTELDTGLAALNDITVAEIIAGIADGSLDLQEMLRLIYAACAGKSDGGGTTTIHFRDSADSKDRITAVVDSDGNRSSVTVDGS